MINIKDWRCRLFPEGQRLVLDSNTDLTIILTIWKRNNIKEQIEALLNQTILPTQIWIYQCGNYVNVNKRLKRYPFVDIFKSTINLKYFGRHTLTQHVETTYTWILDDDIIPSRTWIKTCIEKCEKRNAIVCRSGRIIPANNFFPEVIKDQHHLEQYFVGEGKVVDGIEVCEEDTLVDYGCGSFFFKTEWKKHFWSIWPLTFQNGEDMHLSATCKIQKDILTIVPKQTSAKDSGNLKPDYSFDRHASWKKKGFIEERAEVLKYLIKERKWRPLLWEDCQ